MKLQKCKEILEAKYPALTLQTLNFDFQNELYVMDGSIWIVKIIDSGITIRGGVSISDQLLCLVNELRETYYKLPTNLEY